MDMTLVKSNLCPTCGGLLDIDLDKQMYVCSYCGVSFDYEYFREDNVKEVASKAVKRSEYGSAKDAYDFMLSKDPHDFEALRGLFICKNKWQSMSIMKRDTEVHVSADEPTLQNAIENSRPEDRPYFEKVRDALSELANFRNLTSEAKDLSKRKESERTALGLIKEEYYYNQHQFTELCNEVVEMDAKSREAVITLAIVVPVALVGMLIWHKSWAILIFFVILTTLIIGIYHLWKAINASRLRKSMVPYEKKIQELTEQYEAKSDEAVQSHNRYKTLVQEFMDMDPVARKEDS